jgi:hypothetical protein
MGPRRAANRPDEARHPAALAGERQRSFALLYASAAGATTAEADAAAEGIPGLDDLDPPKEVRT